MEDSFEKLWKVTWEEYECIATIEQENPIQEEDSKPQVYALDFINWASGGYDNYLLLSSADDYIHLYEIQKQQNCTLALANKVISFHFVHYYNFNYGINTIYPKQTYKSCHHTPETSGYGGPRNPNNLIYVFDTSFANYLATALSDGTIRILNTRGVCVCILQLPSNGDERSHLSSVCWCMDNESSYRLASCVSNGSIIIWNIHVNNATDTITPSVRAILQGGHTPSRPIFGAKFIKRFIISWGVDGKICLWDGIAFGDVLAPVGYVAKKEDYPFYACDVFQEKIAAAGGSDGGFIGNPMYLFDINH